MMSASAMSAMIRSKKKKMEEDESGAVKLSGIPEDATDILVMKNTEPGEELSENMPKDRDEDPTLAALMAKTKESQPHEDMAPDPHEIDEDEDKLMKHAKIKAMMMKMGR